MALAQVINIDSYDNYNDDNKNYKINNTNNMEVSNMTINNYVDFYISKKVSENTKKNYMGDIKQFFEYVFGTKDLSLITVDMIRHMGSTKPQQFFQEIGRAHV